VGRLLCTSPGHGNVITPSVVADPDGVHFVVVNHTDQELVYDVNAVSSYRSPAGDIVEPGETAHAVSGLGPGKAHVACDGTFSEGDDSLGPTVRIVDPGHFYSPAGKLHCEGDARAWGTPVQPSQRPKPIPLLHLARHQIMGLGPTDHLSLAGYVHGGYRTVVVARAGRDVLFVDYVRYPKQGWEYYLAEGCAKEGFDIRPLFQR